MAKNQLLRHIYRKKVSSEITDFSTNQKFSYKCKNENIFLSLFYRKENSQIVLKSVISEPKL